MDKQERSLSGILLPVNRAVSLRIVVFSISLACLSFITQGLIWLMEVVLESEPLGKQIVYILCGVAIVGAIVNGYVNDDALGSTTIAFAPLIGFCLFPAALWLFGVGPMMSETGERLLYFGTLTAVFGIVTGFIGVWVGRKYGGGRSSPSLD